MNRREFLLASTAAMAAGLTPALARADVPAPYDWSLNPPADNRASFIDWAVKNRGEDPKYLGERFDRFEVLIANHDIWDDKDKRAFLLTPREEFCRPPNLPRAYANAFLDIGYGVTISGPHLVGRMTNTIDVQRTD